MVSWHAVKDLGNRIAGGRHARLGRL